jgi:hypothetical protein
MAENLKLMRFYLVLLALFTVGRWSLSLAGVSYDKAHHVFSIVTLTLIASAHHAAFARAFRGYGIKRALGLGLMIGFVSQLVVWLSTAASYALGLDTFWNAPRALNVEQAIGFGAAMGGRTIGLVANSITSTIAAAIGWAMGGVLPRGTSA